MKTLLAFFALISLVVTAQAQTTFSFTIPQNVATQQWVEEYVTRKIDSTILVLNSNITKPPTLAKCQEGPVIKSISNIKTTEMTVLFHGVGVKEMDYFVYLENKQIYKARSIPASNTLTLPAPLSAKGNYTLTLTGATCTGTDSMNFTVK